MEDFIQTDPIVVRVHSSRNTTFFLPFLSPSLPICLLKNSPTTYFCQTYKTQTHPMAEIEIVSAPEEPVAAPEEPVAAPEEPAAAPEEPAAAPKEPAAAPEEPAAAPEEGTTPAAASETPAKTPRKRKAAEQGEV
jgi:hypothetical protein